MVFRQMVLLTAVFLVIAIVMQYIQQSTVDGTLLFDQIVTNRVYQLLVLLLILVNGRSVLFRMDDKDV